QEIHVLFRREPTDVADAEGILRNAEDLPEAGAAPASEATWLDARRNHRDRTGNAALGQERGDALAGRDHLVAEVREAGGEHDDEGLQRLRRARYIVGIELVAGVMGEDQRQRTKIGGPQGGPTHQKRVVGMD